MCLEPKRCAKCPTPIIWARDAKSGKPTPIDAAPAKNGNVRLMEAAGEWLSQVLGKDAASAARAKGESLHLNHFVTCPFSKDFRRPK